MENNEHFCIRHPFNGIKNWLSDELNRIKAIIVFLCMLVIVLVSGCCWKCAQFAKDNTDTSNCADTISKITTLDIPTSKCFSETVYISE